MFVFALTLLSSSLHMMLRTHRVHFVYDGIRIRLQMDLVLYERPIGTWIMSTKLVQL
jgi:hypothetical protein